MIHSRATKSIPSGKTIHINLDEKVNNGGERMQPQCAVQVFLIVYFANFDYVSRGLIEGHTVLKKTLKIFLTILAALVVLLAIVLAVSLRLVDSTNFRETNYYKKTSDRIEQALAADPAQAPNELLVGVGKAGITPPVGVPLAGYGARKGAPSTGVHDSLFVRVIALQSGDQQAYIIGYDALILNPPVARRLEAKIKQQLDIPADKFLFTATHTHSGPGGWGETWFEQQFAGPPDSIVATIFVDSSIAAIRRAMADLRPGALADGSVRAPRFIRNRLVGDQGQVDDELVYAAFQRSARTVGVFADYSAHATSLSHHNMEMSGDYPGYLERRMEAKTGGIVLFAAAGLGSHSYRGEGEKFAKSAFVGEGLADSLSAHVGESRAAANVSLRVFRIPVDLARMQVRLTQKICLAPWLAKKLLHPYGSYLQVIALNDFIIIGSPGEYSGELALRVKKTAHEAGKIATITSFNGCYIGYVTPSEYYVLNEYETKLMSWFGPFTGDYLTALMQQIVKAI